MKLVINIPCYNEEATLPLVLKELPKKIPGITTIEVQIVDDGSSDRTVEIARKWGCRVIQHKQNHGLGVAFKTGVEAALEHGADIFVNTDADNQYPSRYIPELIKAVQEGRADIVIGNREPWKVKHFSALKRFLQWFGNGLTRRVAGADVPDTVSGFRAYSREALLRINVTTKFSYVLDTIVQASRKGLRIENIPIETNAPTRKSRLFKNIFQHMQKSGLNLLRCYAIYEPFWTFLYPAIVLFGAGFGLGVRWIVLAYFGTGGQHIQSLILATILLILGGIMGALAIIAALIGINRKMTEEQLYLAKKQYYDKRR